MAFFIEVATLIPTLEARLGDAGDLARAQVVMRGMTDAEIVAVLQESTDAVQQIEQVRLVAAGIAAARSAREAGHSGLSQARGHASPVALVQQITGSTRAEAARQVRVGESLIESVTVQDGPEGPGSAGAAAGAGGDWREPLRVALRARAISAAQFDAIRSGLGEPPASDRRDDDADGGDSNSRDVDGENADGGAGANAPACETWARAAEQLIREASERTVEELRTAARSIRDLLDPEGAQTRFLARYENRSFRTYIDRDGVRRGSIVFDEEGGAFVEAAQAAAMRPRRGGPRFVDPAEKERASALTDDPRSNDQLAYDLLLDVFRAGVLADAKTVFGTRQPGLRLVQTVDDVHGRAPTAHTEDHLVTLPASVAEQHVCDSGIVPITVDSHGDPLDVGREQRLYTSAQRIALAIRDGGCRWRGCDRPASYCEAHHIDEWAGGGRTDIDRGILLCRFHHMNLHHHGWRITREGRAEFMLHAPSGERFTLRARAVLTYAWAGIDPPPRRFHPAARTPAA